MSSNSIYSLPLYYVYKVTNKETGEFYIGSRFAHVKKNRTPEQDFLIYYFTSSVHLKEDIKQNTTKYQSEILYRSNEMINVGDAESLVAYWYEQLLIRENIDNPLCANGQYKDPDTDMKSFTPTGEVKRLAYIKAAQSRQAFYDLMTEQEQTDYHKARGTKIAETKRNKSKEEKELYSRNCSIAAKKVYETISKDDRLARAHRRKASMSDDKISSMRAQMKESMKQHLLITHYCELCNRTIGSGNPAWARHLKSKAHKALTTN